MLAEIKVLFSLAVTEDALDIGAGVLGELLQQRRLGCLTICQILLCLHGQIRHTRGDPRRVFDFLFHIQMHRYVDNLHERVRVCLCFCVREREGERETGRQTNRDKEKWTGHQVFRWAYRHDLIERLRSEEEGREMLGLLRVAHLHLQA